jgi:hypothetical protein
MMKVKRDNGYKPSINVAREEYPGFTEDSISSDKIKEVLHECPRCEGVDFKVCGGTFRCYIERVGSGRSVAYCGESEEVQPLEVIVCHNCKTIFVVDCEQGQPGVAEPIERESITDRLRSKHCRPGDTTMCKGNPSNNTQEERR